MSDDEGFPVPPLSLLPRLTELQAVNRADFSLNSLINIEGNLDLAVAHAQYFWPEFVEVESCIIFKDRFNSENLQNWIQSLEGDLSRVESIINHTHFYDFTLNDPRQEEQQLETYEYLAKVAMRTWRAALAEQFPDRRFEFRYVTEPDDYGPTLYFCQIRDVPEGDSK